MAPLDDPQGYGQKFANQLAKLRAADIVEADREAIKAFIHALEAEGNVNRGTIIGYLNCLRLSAERADSSLIEMGHDAVNRLLFRLKHDYELSDGTLRNYRKALRRFYSWRDEPWAEDITIGTPIDRSVDPDELLDRDEIDALLEAAKNPRDRALVAILADTGLRIGALAAVRVKDVDLTGEVATIAPNPNANNKGFDSTVPLTWSEGHLTTWLSTHPRREDPDAPLIHKLKHYDDDDGSLSSKILNKQLKRLADNAGFDRNRVRSKLFRKSAISRWIREGLSEQAIRHRAGWEPDSDMFQIYSGVREEELNASIAEHYGLADPDTTATPTIEQCPRCNTTVDDSHRFCPSCGRGLDEQAVRRISEAEDGLREDLVELDDADLREVVAIMLEDIEDPTVVDELLDG